MPLKVIVLGGVAAGPKAAAKIMRLNPEAEVDGGMAVWPFEKLNGKA